MSRDDFNDYEELLNLYSSNDTSSREKKEPATKKNTTSSRSDFDTDFLRSENERKKRVQNFNVDISSDSTPEKRSFKSGVYFSNPPRDIDKEAQREKMANSTAPRMQRTQKTAKEPKVPNAKKFEVSAPPATEKQKKLIAKKKAKAQKRANTFLGKLLSSEKLSKVALFVAIVGLTSVILCIYGIGCINDVLAIKTDDVAVEVNVSQGMSDGDVIDILGDNDLIKHELFCKLFIKAFGKSGDYVSGVYTLTPSMGVEDMLATMKADVTLSETVTLTFPEGWTVDQMAEKLESNEVCSASAFLTTIRTVDFSEEYDFIAAIPNKDKRFRLLEGYMYPDTYEFYIGENASSVVRKFLDNFKNKWTDEYQKQADKLGVSLDEVITLASILQEEAASTEQMADISSVLYNRLNKPASFQWLQCDSTETYLLETIKPTLTSSTEDTQKYIEYRDNYDTYSTACTGLPIGAIANPGNAAIKAALNPSDTGYYYFRHDTKGGVYYASTFAEHERNGRKAAEVDDK